MGNEIGHFALLSSLMRMHLAVAAFKSCLFPLSSVNSCLKLETFLINDLWLFALKKMLANEVWGYFSLLRLVLLP